MSTEETEVLVVGGGPVGLTLAAELSHHEVNTILIEKNQTTSDSVKAMMLNSRTMEHFRTMGLEEKIRVASYPRNQLFALQFSSGFYKGHQLFVKKFSSWGEVVDGVKGASYPYYQYGATISAPMVCPQFSSEALIRKHVEDNSSCVKMFWGWRVLSISENEDGVTAKAVNADGEEKFFKARYLVGCDGGTSFVRKELGIHTFGHFVVAKACTIAFRSPELFEHQKHTKTCGLGYVMNSDIVCVTVLLNAKGEYAFHIFVAPTLSNADELVQWYVDNPKKAIALGMGSNDITIEEVQHVSAYHMHALISTKFKEGRCFLAGDSAHQWLPAGGLGCNIGICDVGNLSWKLAAMVKGYGGKHLLDSYEAECRPMADSARRFAMNYGRTSIVGSRAVIKVRQMLMSNQITRQLFGRLVGSRLALQVANATNLTLGFQYSGSSVIAHHYNEDGSVKLCQSKKGDLVPSSLPGCRAPHVVLPELPTILDLFGKNFVLLIIGGVESDLKELKEVMTKKGVPFSTHTYPPLSELTQFYDRKYFLVRA